MAQPDCRAFKAQFLRHLSKNTRVSSDDSGCLFALPIETLDGRFVQVQVRGTVGNKFLVHDGGSAAGELHIQGVHITDPKREALRAIARRMGATLSSSDSFEILCAQDVVGQAMLAVAQCSAVAMAELLIQTEAETLRAQLTEVTRERDDALHEVAVVSALELSNLHRAESVEAALAPLRAVVTAAKAFMLKWPDAEKAINGAIVIATVHSCPYVGPSLEDELHALRRALSALPADPSAPACTGNADTCPVDECIACGERDCPHHEPLHYHHDGCPACTPNVR